VRQTDVDLELVPASESDADELAALRVVAMRESLERIGRFDAERARRRFLDAFSPEATRHIVVAGVKVGFVVVIPRSGHVLLDHLYVHPDHQGVGIGSAVLVRLFAEADRRNQTIRVGALRESDSNRFYTRHGFELVESGEWDNYYVRIPAPTS